jgi:hypothetical protein
MHQFQRHQLFAGVTFSVVRHPQKTEINSTNHALQSLVNPRAGFFAFESTRLVGAVTQRRPRSSGGSCTYRGASAMD